MVWVPVSCAVALFSLSWAYIYSDADGHPSGPALGAFLSLSICSSLAHTSCLFSLIITNLSLEFKHLPVLSQTLHLGLHDNLRVTFISQMRTSGLPIVRHYLTAEPRLTHESFLHQNFSHSFLCTSLPCSARHKNLF